MHCFVPSEDDNGQEEEATTLFKEGEHDSEPSFLQRPGKEAAAEDVDDIILPPECMQECRRRAGDHIDIDSDHESKERSVGERGGRQFRIHSLSTKYSRQVIFNLNSCLTEFAVVYTGLQVNT